MYKIIKYFSPKTATRFAVLGRVDLDSLDGQTIDIKVRHYFSWSWLKKVFLGKKKAVVHPRYIKGYPYNDLALLELKKPIGLGGNIGKRKRSEEVSNIWNEGRATLADLKIANNQNDSYTVLGWGLKVSGNFFSGDNVHPPSYG